MKLSALRVGFTVAACAVLAAGCSSSSSGGGGAAGTTPPKIDQPSAVGSNT